MVSSFLKGKNFERHSTLYLVKTNIAFLPVDNSKFSAKLCSYYCPAKLVWYLFRSESLRQKDIFTNFS